MTLRTEIEVPRFGFSIDHLKGGVCIGSCFAENIGGRMAAAKFPVTVNPFGVLYNPFSVADTIEMLAAGREFVREDLETDGDLWYSMAHHGSFSATDEATALDRMNWAAREGARALERAGYVVITLGTAWVYERGGRVVANCHKLPAAQFARRRLSVEEIVGRFSALLEGPLKGKNIVLTVSPVRHVKDGLQENTVSKSVLHLAAGELAAKYPGQVVVFPAYEMLVDDLRDYRFYASDMVHPSAVAVDYVWGKFCAAAMAPPTIDLIARIGKITAAAAHRPFNEESAAHRRFLDSMLGEARKLQAGHPEINLSTEIEYFARH